MLQWQHPLQDGGKKIKTFNIYVKSKTTNDEWIKVGSVDGMKTKIIFPELDENTAHYFGVTAINDVGEGDMAKIDTIKLSKYSVGKYVLRKEIQNKTD